MAVLRKLSAPPSPNLPVAPTEYSTSHFDVLNNVLRLYFNRLFEALKNLLGTDGGAFLQFPHIAASDSTDQYATATNTPTIVKWNTLATGSGFTLNPSSTATANQNGIYKITYSLQFINTDNVIHDAVVWLQVDGVDVTDSATSFSIPARKSAGVYSYGVAYSEVVFTLYADSEVALYWATTQAYDPVGPVDGVYMFADVAQVSPYPRPAIPSALGSITFVSAVTT